MFFIYLWQFYYLGMKKLIIILIFPFWLICACFSQSETHLNAPRSGDEVVRHTITLTSPGASGKNVVWDIGQLKVRRKKYVRRYAREGNMPDSVSATERGTRYYYNVREEGIYETGYENNQTRIAFDMPIRDLSFPIVYGDSMGGFFHGTGTYCDRQRMRSFGSWTLKADAEGCIVLPSGDTLRNVLRVHLHKRISTRFHPMDSIYQALPVFNTDSIIRCQAADGGMILNDSYRWYAHGYRYPILEYQTARMEARPDGEVSIAYYCSPEDQQELPLDDENIRARGETTKKSSNDGGYNNTGNKNFRYTFTQNFGNRSVHVGYTADSPVDVKAVLTSSTGIIYKTRTQAGLTSGSIDLDYNGLQPGQYVVYIKTGNEIYTEKFNNR